MKIRFAFLALLLIAVFISCKKNTTDPSVQKFGFVLNTVAYDWDLPFGINAKTGALIIKTPVSNGINDTIYLLQGWDQSKNISINLALPTKILTTGVYKTKTTVSTGYIFSSYVSNGIQYLPTNMGDSTEVTITNITNNYVDGFFKALMHDFSTKTNQIQIVNGYFNHIEISK